MFAVYRFWKYVSYTTQPHYCLSKRQLSIWYGNVTINNKGVDFFLDTSYSRLTSD